MQTIHLSNGQIGLTAEEKQQIQQLHLGLPYGLLEAFHELGARTDSSNPYRTMAYIIAKLQPRAASFVPVSLRVVHILHTKNGIKEFVTYRTKMVLNTITRYNGVWKTQWEIIGGSGTQHVVLLGATLIHKNYAPLYEAEKAFDVLPRISDQQLLFRQALLLDQNFCDPAALSILDGMIGGGLPPSKGVPLPPQQLIAIFREAIRIRMQYNATHGIAGGANETWLPYLVTIAYHESGYNPDAYNPKYISDGGSPSGLMQVLPSTFREYEISPYDDIWNPLDNAIAALGRIQGAWTVPWDIPGVVSGKYKGY
ncbi:transglycosylase SLT domain-containing protein [Sulfoacidibacillus thermotolerans]|nr:transglycosylase SLT domain-containing protein [Sulfoacidibacillus thermotolerans]PWI56563.1 hypothetical protein BM613_13015 [Sulfoacidibacillus thermotolerans]